MIFRGELLVSGRVMMDKDPSFFLLMLLDAVNCWKVRYSCFFSCPNLKGLGNFQKLPSLLFPCALAR